MSSSRTRETRSAASASNPASDSSRSSNKRKSTGKESSRRKRPTVTRGNVSDADMTAAFEQFRTDKTKETVENVGLDFEEWVISTAEDAEDGANCRAVLTGGKVDYRKLANRLTHNSNAYFAYSFAHQAEAVAKNQSGISYQATLQTAMFEKFEDAEVTLTDQQKKRMKRWSTSAKKRDREAKQAPNSSIPYTNARDALPFKAYKLMAGALWMEPDTKMIALFTLQWNMLSRSAQVALMDTKLCFWDNDHLQVGDGKGKMEHKGKKTIPRAIMCNRYDFTLCAITALAGFLSTYEFNSTHPSNRIFPEKIHKQYADDLQKWLKKEYVVELLKEWEHLKMGTHMSRKGGNLLTYFQDI